MLNAQVQTQNPKRNLLGMSKERSLNGVETWPALPLCTGAGENAPEERELVQARVSRCTHYVLEVVYERKAEQASVDPSLFAALTLA